MKLLNKTRLLDWTLPTSFLHLPAPLVDPITQMLQRKFTGHTHTWRGTQFIMDKKSQKGVPLRCPSGYRLAHLGKRGITLMLKTSQFSSVYTLAEFQDFSANVPCVGLFLDPSQKEDYTVDKKLPQADDADFPILYVAVCYSGAIGMLGCDENHWQDGLVGLLVQVCGRLMADMGLISNICVQDSNVTLRSVMDLLPGWETGSAVTRAWTCDGTLCP
ncbi:hypothetical protein E2C01_079878 [Portunus trituberculatus]|uniref:Uncharacterized protein n=2 Tax=Portunus trituberculatus TaxID=210409 RepID=A0A5B7ISH1_PORTR|nr:hypothetical protein [Portunus trituberculatus]